MIAHRARGGRRDWRLRSQQRPRRSASPSDASIAYRPRSEATDAETLAAELAERRDGDIARGYTGWGPHHDELAIESGGRSLRRYGSQGQQRAALLALLFAERDALIADGRPAPLMLLDDVTSELDADHRGLLVEHLARRRRPGADHGHGARSPARVRRAQRDRDPRRPARSATPAKQRTESAA